MLDLKEFEAQALQLEPQDRAALAEYLIASQEKGWTLPKMNAFGWEKRIDVIRNIRKEIFQI